MSSYDDDGDRHTSKGDDHGRGGSSPYRHKHKSRESNSERSRDWNRDRHPRDYKERDVRDNRGRNRNSYGRSSNRDYERLRYKIYSTEIMIMTEIGIIDTDHVLDQTRNIERDLDLVPALLPKVSACHLVSCISNISALLPCRIFKRTSGFDMAPPVTSFLGVGAIPGQLTGVPQAMPGILQNMLPFGATQVNPLGALSLMPAQAMTQQVLAIQLQHFLVVLWRLSEEILPALGVSVRVRRPTDYNPSLAAALGPSQPNPHLNLAAVRLTPGMVGGVEGPDRIFVGGLPYYFTEVQIRELLESFGPLRGFDLVKDRDTGNSKGYGFCIYKDPMATDVACAALNGLKMGDKTLTVRRATMSNEPVNSEQESILAQAQQHIALQKMTLQAGGVNLPGIGIGPMTTGETPTKVLCLTEVITSDELMDDGDYEEILEDMRDEGGKFGLLKNVVIPRPAANGDQVAGVGKVFLEYADTSGCASAKDALGGRKFGGNTVTAVYYSEDKFYDMDYGA
ncbi:hypothetical protein C3L33_15508, partial [Rhododendron williamsianum]